MQLIVSIDVSIWLVPFRTKSHLFSLSESVHLNLNNVSHTLKRKTERKKNTYKEMTASTQNMYN